MPDEPKITFAEVVEPFMLEAIKVISEEARKSFGQGFDKAVEMFKVVTQPAPQAPASVIQNFGDPEEETDFGPGVLNMAAINQMSPVAREAVLASYGLQQAEAPAPVVDPVHAEVARTTGQAPITEEEGE